MVIKILLFHLKVNVPKLYLSTNLLILTTLVHAQQPTVEWFRGHGTNTEEHVHEGMQTSDGGYIAIGHGIEPSGVDDMLIIKINKDGNFEWMQEFGSKNKKGSGYCITETSDGFIAGGAIFNPDSQRTQRFLAKIDHSGEKVWEKYYGSAGVGGIRGIDLCDDGNIIVTGYKNTPNLHEFRGFVFIVDEGDGFIMKLDTSGNAEWEKLLDSPQGTKVREIEDGYAVCSTVWNEDMPNGEHQDFCLIKTDNKGNKIWRKLYGGSANDHLYDFDLTKDDGYILAGHTLSYGVANWDYLLMKIDSNGSKNWHKTFGQPRDYDARYIHDEAYGVCQTIDGGYIIAGGSGDEYSYSATGHPAGPSDEWKVYLVKTNSAGSIVWEGLYPPYSVGNNGGEYIGLTGDGGYIVFVDTDTQKPPSPNNYGFLKLSQDRITSVSRINLSIRHSCKLYKNYPNPFNPKTIISFEIQQTEFVSINIFNSQGRKVKTLLNEKRAAGFHQINFDATGLASGIYYYRINSGKYTDTQKCLLLR